MVSYTSRLLYPLGKHLLVPVGQDIEWSLIWCESGGETLHLSLPVVETWLLDQQSCR
jgi:hypothetical protein